MARTTTLDIDGEMAFWMRWGMDHIGDNDLSSTSVLFGWNPGGVTEENRESRDIENVEKEQFEGDEVKIQNLHERYKRHADTERKLIGDSSDFDTISISVDLMGETRVVNHPLSITFPHYKH